MTNHLKHIDKGAEKERADLLFLLSFKRTVIHPFDHVMQFMFPDQPIANWCAAHLIQYKAFPLFLTRSQEERIFIEFSYLYETDALSQIQ